MLTKDISRRHEEHKRWSDCLETVEFLYCGGGILEANASKVVAKRPKEVEDVYQARLRLFNYQNIIGTVIGWWEAALFAKEPAVDVKRGDKVNEGADEFAGFIENCDRRGTTLFDFFRGAFVDAVLYRRSYVLVDLPAPSDEVRTLAEQKAKGELDPYLVRFDPRQVINWSCDALGILEWLVIETDEVERVFGGADKAYRVWRYYDRERFRTFRAEIKEGKPEETATEVAFGAHALAGNGTVPVFMMELPDALWLGNRAYLQAKAHLNKTCALDFGMFMACLPIPWVKGQVEGSATVSESAYLALADDGEVGYLEPSGVAFEHQAKSLASLREEIYRQMYLQAQGRSTEATPAAQSGYSKEMDMAPARDVLGKYGDVVRAAMRAVLRMAAVAGGDKEADFSIRGFQFAETDPNGGIQTVKMLEESGCPSTTLVKAAWKKTAREIAPDEPAEFYDTVDAEFDAGVKSAEEKADEELARQKDLMGAKLKEKVAA